MVDSNLYDYDSRMRTFSVEVLSSGLVKPFLDITLLPTVFDVI